MANQCPYPPSSTVGLINDHDRPYSEYGHLSMTASFANVIYSIDGYDLGADTICQEFKFDLAGVETVKKRNSNNFRMVFRMFAIFCRTKTKRKTSPLLARYRTML